MHLSIKKKKLIILSSLFLWSCAAQDVKCHEWTSHEKEAIAAELQKLPDANPLHPVIRDYERVCIATD